MLSLTSASAPEIPTAPALPLVELAVAFVVTLVVIETDPPALMSWPAA